MTLEKRILFTESGKRRFDLLVTELRENIEAELARRKRFPGEGDVEVSGSDVENISRSVRLTMLGSSEDKLITRDLFVKLYLITGMVMLAAGIFLPKIRSWKDDPVQAMLVVTGLLTTAEG